MSEIWFVWNFSREAEQTVWRSEGRRRRVFRGQTGRVLRIVRTVGVRQVNDLANDRRS